MEGKSDPVILNVLWGFRGDADLGCISVISNSASLAIIVNWTADEHCSISREYSNYPSLYLIK